MYNSGYAGHWGAYIMDNAANLSRLVIQYFTGSANTSNICFHSQGDGGLGVWEIIICHYYTDREQNGCQFADGNFKLQADRSKAY